ncbi:MAG: translation elongation factor Ts [Eubacteriales bacterium]|nr:translation elongation factor Ts [Eubacteriales bacterium]MDD4079000.1 translation elongation factor Ts [Eubacteriales bacterium]
MSAEQVKELRALTGAGFMDCKRALEKTGGDVSKAVDLLREKGLAAAAKKSGRITAEGAVGSYIHGNGRIGVLVEVNCETDFVAKNSDFQDLVHDICMHVAAANPRYVAKENVAPEVLEHEKQVLINQAINEGKKPEIAEKVVAGRLEKFLSEICLLEQPFVKDPDISVGKLVQQKIAQFGENISVRRFARFEMGEGLQKRQDDFAAEIAKLQQK